MNKTMKNLKQHQLSLELACHEYRPSTLQVNQHTRPKISRLFKLQIYIMTIQGVTQTQSWSPLLQCNKICDANDTRMKNHASLKYIFS
jgi:isochorismate synthase EntC